MPDPPDQASDCFVPRFSFSKSAGNRWKGEGGKVEEWWRRGGKSVRAMAVRTQLGFSSAPRPTETAFSPRKRQPSLPSAGGASRSRAMSGAGTRVVGEAVEGDSIVQELVEVGEEKQGANVRAQVHFVAEHEAETNPEPEIVLGKGESPRPALFYTPSSYAPSGGGGGGGGNARRTALRSASDFARGRAAGAEDIGDGDVFYFGSAPRLSLREHNAHFVTDVERRVNGQSKRLALALSLAKRDAKRSEEGGDGRARSEHVQQASLSVSNDRVAGLPASSSSALHLPSSKDVDDDVVQRLSALGADVMAAAKGQRELMRAVSALKREVASAAERTHRSSSHRKRRSKHERGSGRRRSSRAVDGALHLDEAAALVRLYRGRRRPIDVNGEGDDIDLTKPRHEIATVSLQKRSTKFFNRLEGRTVYNEGDNKVDYTTVNGGDGRSRTTAVGAAIVPAPHGSVGSIEVEHEDAHRLRDLLSQAEAALARLQEKEASQVSKTGEDASSIAAAVAETLGTTASAQKLRSDYEAVVAARTMAQTPAARSLPFDPATTMPVPQSQSIVAAVSPSPMPPAPFESVQAITSAVMDSVKSKYRVRMEALAAKSAIAEKRIRQKWLKASALSEDNASARSVSVRDIPHVTMARTSAGLHTAPEPTSGPVASEEEDIECANGAGGHEIARAADHDTSPDRILSSEAVEAIKRAASARVRRLRRLDAASLGERGVNPIKICNSISDMLFNDMLSEVCGEIFDSMDGVVDNIVDAELNV